MISFHGDRPAKLFFPTKKAAGFSVRSLLGILSGDKFRGDLKTAGGRP
jgi:hypothetical protein